MRLAAVLAIILTSASLSSQSVPQNTDAYEITLLAGVGTSTLLKDGIGEEATFIQPGGLWGDGTYLYVGDGSALRRIEIATRRVTTITRLAGSGQFATSASSFFSSGLSSVWGDGSSLYVTDVGDHSVRRVNASTGVVEVIGRVGFPRGIVGDARYLYVANSSGHTIKKIDRTNAALTDFVTPPGPLDPSTCSGGSGCINYFVPSPTSLSIDGENIYATGFDTTLRIINASTSEVTSSPQLPFRPNAVWGNSGVLYYTEYRGNRIGRLVVATGEASVIFTGALSLGAIWGESNSLYVVEDDHIVRVDLLAGTSQLFAGTDRQSIDGVGASARFISLRGIWSDGTSLFSVDGTNLFSVEPVVNRIRKLNLATSEVTTLPIALTQSLNLWGDGTYLYVIDGTVIRRIRWSDGDTTTLGPVQAGSSSRPWSDGTALYVSESSRLQKIPLDGSAISTVASGFTGGASDVWGDGSNVYFGMCRGSCGQVFRYSIATGQTTVLATLPTPNSGIDPVHGIWGSGQELFVTGGNSGQVWRISLATGEIRPLIRAGSGPDSGKALKFSSAASGIWGDGANLHVVEDRAIYRLTPSSMPPFSGFQTSDRGAASNVTASTSDAITVGSGSIELDPTSAPEAGFATFTYRQNGIVVSEAAVPASAPMRRGRIYASTAGPVNTGLAIMNPNDQTVTINFYFTDTSGNNFGQGSFTISARGQMARFLSETPFRRTSPFASQSVPATLTFDSSIPVSAIALRGYLNERSEFLMTTLPVLDLSAAVSMNPVVMAHFADGGGWMTSVVLVNPTDQTIGGNMEFYSDDGTLLSRAQYTVAARSSFVYRTTNSVSQIQTGSIRVVPSALTGSPSGVSIFSFRKDGVIVTEAGVPTVTAKPAFRLYTESIGDGLFRQGRAGTLETGVAIANASSSEITVYFEATTIQGMPIRTDKPSVGSLTIPAQGHRSVFLNEIFTFPIFIPPYPIPERGVLRIWTDSPEGISIAGLRGRYNERGDFLITTTPPAPESFGATPTPVYFPHIVQGGGYTTQIVVFGNTPGLTSSGRIRYFSQSGIPLTVPLY